MSTIISGLKDIAGTYDYFILDIFGVIHNGIEPFPGTKQCLEELNAAGKQICLLSNSPRRAAGAAGQINTMGIPQTLFHHTVTSGEATYQALGQMDKSAKCWFIGTDTMAEVLEGHDLEILDGPQGADFILNSVPGLHSMNSQTFLNDLKTAAKNNLPMICANPDLVVNIGDKQYECAGTFAAMYENMGGTVTYHGKPHGPVYEQCYDFFGRPDKSKICAVGDSIHTDITGANRFGISGVFNIEGIHEEELTCKVSGTIDDTLITTMLKSQPEKPTYIIKGFQW